MKQDETWKIYLDDEEKALKELKKVFRQAAKDCQNKIAELDTRTDWENISSIIYQKKYQNTLLLQLNEILADLEATQYSSIREYLEQCYANGYIGALYDISLQGVPIITPIDQVDVVRALTTDSKISDGLYTHLGENVDKLKTDIRMNLSRAIANGSSWSKAAERLAMDMNSPFTKAMNNSMRIVRTEGHRIQCRAQMDACKHAKDRGADVVKQWDATLDGLTRTSHIHLDGEIKEIDEKFSNGLNYPGDSIGPAEEVINCRCRLLKRARWNLSAGISKYDMFTNHLQTFNTPEDYDEFKEWYFSDENVAYMKYVQKLEVKYGTKRFDVLLDSMTEREYEHFSRLEASSPMWNRE